MCHLPLMCFRCRCNGAISVNLFFKISSYPWFILKNVCSIYPVYIPPAISCSNRCRTFSIRISPHLFLAVLFEFKIERQDQVGSLPLWPPIKSSDIYYLSDCHPCARSGLSFFFFMCGATFLLIPPQAAVCIHIVLVINSSTLQLFALWSILSVSNALVVGFGVKIVSKEKKGTVGLKCLWLG